MSRLTDTIPDPDTRWWLGCLAYERGSDIAARVAADLADGTLVLMPANVIIRELDAGTRPEEFS